MAKRLLDLLAALFGLLLLAPLLLLIAAAIKLDSPGPVFFRQERVGRHGRNFRIFKFRTMETLGAARTRNAVGTVSTAGAPQLTVAGDLRITRCGAFLRRYKLDELAQLIDVLRGTMSLVGPRPEVPHYVRHYPDASRERVLSVRPGITDMASIRYRDENDLLALASDPEQEYIEVILPSKLRYALDYVDHATLAGDLRVLGLTLRTVFIPEAASTRSLFAMNDSKLWAWLEPVMSTLNPRRRWFALAFDAATVFACWQVTYLFRLGFERWQPERPSYDNAVAAGIVLLYIAFMALTGVPRALWRYFGFDDFKHIAAACLMAGLTGAVAVLMAQLVGVPRAVLALHPLFCMLALSLSRMTYRMVWEHARSRVTGAEGEPRRAIVLGAGHAARGLVAGIHRRDGWSVLALLDDDPAKKGLRIAGIPVLGAIADLARPDMTTGATHIIVAMPGASAAQRERAVALARKTGLLILTVPSQLELQAEAVTP